MQTQITAALRGTEAGDAAAAIIGKCVHCGFCLATCPTYRLSGDELDGPRGRIYLMKQVVEGREPTAKTQLHLDRCLTCRACETNCPSGVQYARLLDIGRDLVASKVQRTPLQRLVRSSLRFTLTRPRLFAALLAAGRALRVVLPRRLRVRIPPQPPMLSPRSPPPSPVPASERPPSRPRKMLLLAGCVQPALAPNINAATTRVLGALGIDAVIAPAAGCCGAMRHHLDDQPGALTEARRNIDAWWPWCESGVEAIVTNASGCGTMVRDYGHLLRHDNLYAAKAARVSGLARDLAEIVTPHCADLRATLANAAAKARVVFQAPCSLQHGQKLPGIVEALLIALGVELLPSADAQQCCGSAGTYSMLQSVMSESLRARKLEALNSGHPGIILSANIGCIVHLAAATPVPVRHWIEWVDELLAVKEASLQH